VGRPGVALLRLVLAPPEPSRPALPPRALALPLAPCSSGSIGARARAPQLGERSPIGGPSARSSGERSPIGGSGGLQLGGAKGGGERLSSNQGERSPSPPRPSPHPFRAPLETMRPASSLGGLASEPDRGLGRLAARARAPGRS
jgi:hypothetical protein